MSKWSDLAVGQSVKYHGPTENLTDEFNILKDNYYEITSKDPPTFKRGVNITQIMLDKFPNGNDTEFVTTVNVSSPAAGQPNNIGFQPRRGGRRRSTRRNRRSTRRNRSRKH